MVSSVLLETIFFMYYLVDGEVLTTVCAAFFSDRQRDCVVVEDWKNYFISLEIFCIPSSKLPRLMSIHSEFLKRATISGKLFSSFL